MTISKSATQTAADNLIKEAAEEASSGVVYFQRLSSTSPASGPYDEEPDKEYESPGTSVIAWVKLEIETTELATMNLELMKIGATKNVDGIFYVSKLESDSKSLGLSVDFGPDEGRFLHNSVYHAVMRVVPKSHVQGEPAYFKVYTSRGRGIP
jgi:hypothetical protein